MLPVRVQFCFMAVIVVQSVVCTKEVIKYIIGSSPEHSVHYVPPKHYRYLKFENDLRIDRVYNEIITFEPEFILLTGGLTYHGQVTEIDSFFDKLSVFLDRRVPVAMSLGTTDIY